MPTQDSLNYALMSMHAYNVGLNPHLSGLDRSGIGSASYIKTFQDINTGRPRLRSNERGILTLRLNEKPGDPHF